MEKLTKTSGENNSAMEYECEKYIAPEYKYHFLPPFMQ